VSLTGGAGPGRHSAGYPGRKGRGGAGPAGRWYILNVICTGLPVQICRRITSEQITAA
jgi:hypothetical protein